MIISNTEHRVAPLSIPVQATHDTNRVRVSEPYTCPLAVAYQVYSLYVVESSLCSL